MRSASASRVVDTQLDGHERVYAFDPFGNRLELIEKQIVAGVPGWVPDELATAGRENLDPLHVARYDAKEDADPAGEVAHARLGSDARVAGHGVRLRD